MFLIQTLGSGRGKLKTKLVRKALLLVIFQKFVINFCGKFLSPKDCSSVLKMGKHLHVFVIQILLWPWPGKKCVKCARKCVHCQWIKWHTGSFDHLFPTQHWMKKVSKEARKIPQNWWTSQNFLKSLVEKHYFCYFSEDNTGGCISLLNTWLLSSIEKEDWPSIKTEDCCLLNLFSCHAYLHDHYMFAYMECQLCNFCYST